MVFVHRDDDGAVLEDGLDFVGVAVIIPPTVGVVMDAQDLVKALGIHVDRTVNDRGSDAGDLTVSVELRMIVSAWTAMCIRIYLLKRRSKAASAFQPGVERPCKDSVLLGGRSWGRRDQIAFRPRLEPRGARRQRVVDDGGWKTVQAKQ